MDNALFELGPLERDELAVGVLVTVVLDKEGVRFVFTAVGHEPSWRLGLRRQGKRRSVRWR